MYHLCRRRCRRTAAAPRGGAAPARWRAHCRHTGRRRRRASSAPGARPPTRCHWPCGVRITWKTGLQGSLAIPLSGRKAKAGVGVGAGARARQGEARAQPPRERVRPSRFELSGQRRAHARMVHRAATWRKPGLARQCCFGSIARAAGRTRIWTENSRAPAAVAGHAALAVHHCEERAAQFGAHIRQAGRS